MRNRQPPSPDVGPGSILADNRCPRFLIHQSVKSALEGYPTRSYFSFSRISLVG